MELYLDQDINKMVADQLSFEIKNTKEKEIKLYINSPGGSIFDGYNLFNALVNFKGKTIAVLNGLAASMAFPIALACDEMIIADYSLIMLHNPNLGKEKNLTDKDYEILDKFKSSLLTIMSNRSGMDKVKLSKMMTEETWLTAEEVKKLFGKAPIKVYTTKRKDLKNRLLSIYNKIKDFDMKETNEKIEEAMDASNEVENEVTETVENKETEEVKSESTEEEVKNEEEEVKEDEVSNEEEEMEEDKDFEMIIQKLEEKIASLEEELSEYKEEEMKKEEEMITNVLDQAKDRLTDEEYTKWKNIGKSDFNFMKSNVEKISNINIKNETKIDDVVMKENINKDELIDVRKMEKEDPKKLAEIMENNFELYKKSWENSYGVEYTDK